jgi:hypothetical protein
MYTEKLIEKIAKKTNIDISKFDMKELVMGMEVELEHGSQNIKTDITNDEPIETFKIVMAHMNEMPDYYTKLKKMEKKQNISEYAKRMKELAGISEGEKNKTLKTIQEGKSDKKNIIKESSEGVIDGKTHKLPFHSLEDVLSAAESDDNMYSFLNSELEVGDTVELIGGELHSGSDIFDLLRGKKKGRNSIAELNISESDDFDGEEFIPHGSYTVSNLGGYEVMINDSGDAAKVRDAYGSEEPKISDWLEIEYIEDEEGEFSPVIDPEGYNIPLNMVMRINENKSNSDSLEEFEIHEFKQNEFEGSDDDEELYNLNENTIIVLDFLDDEE